MSKYPECSGTVNTAQMGLRVSKDLKERFRKLRDHTPCKVGEAMRIALLDLADALEEKYADKLADK